MMKGTNNIILISVRRGLTLMIPLLLIGSFALIILSLPIKAYHDVMESVFGSHWGNLFVYVRDGTFNIMALLMVICISYSYASESKSPKNSAGDPIIASIVALSAFIAFSGMSDEGFSLSYFGVLGVFSAILVAIMATGLFMKLCSFRILSIRTYTDGADSVFNDALSSILPATITVVVFAAGKYWLTGYLGVSDLQTLLSGFFIHLFERIDSSLLRGILFIFLVHFFWFFGIHGSNVLESVSQNTFVPALSQNQVFVAHGMAPTEILTKTFLDCFVLMGGSGTTLALILAIFIFGKYKNVRRHAKLSALPALFNINELIVFGIPIVLNPIYLFPFLFVPILLTAVSYAATYCGLVPYTTTLVEWTTPIFLSGYASTGSIAGSILQLINLTIGVLCYIPFVRKSEERISELINQNISKICELFRSTEQQGIGSVFLARRDDIGNTARFLIADLTHDLQCNKLALYYQPQVDYQGNVFGAEALLRWKHEHYGYIYPPLVISLAEEGQLMDKMGYWILDRACADLRRFIEAGFKEMTISVNISAKQLESESFLRNLKEVITRHQVPAHLLKLEITEQLALSRSQNIRDKLKAMKALGIKLAMDDFGMGHSSLMYLKEYQFDTIKLDGSLIKEILTNHTCSDIISSIVFLSKSMYFSIIAEYVEHEEQREKLYNLGCSQYQGYLYSPAVDQATLMVYLQDG